jgi:hypothetical protein
VNQGDVADMRRRVLRPQEGYPDFSILEQRVSAAASFVAFVFDPIVLNN